MVRVAILGARGYTALESIRLLLRNGEVEITALTTRDDSRPHVSAVHPQLTGQLDLVLENLTPSEVASRADCVFCCLPHAASAAVVEPLLDEGLRVVDFSADYRLTDPDVYRQWYQVEHPNPERMRNTVYGLPELFREQIRGAELIANPGCFPTTAILALAPLLKLGLIDREGIIVDSKTGVSGAGRDPKPHLHFPECNESVAAYAVGAHRHMPEIDDVLSTFTQTDVRVLFTPHLIPMDRGILTTNYAVPTGNTSSEALQDALREFYAGEPFVRVVEHLPATKHVSHTNYCDLTARRIGDRVVVICVTDNLVKGASGAAVQNFNVMFGFEETTSLLN